MNALVRRVGKLASFSISGLLIALCVFHGQTVHASDASLGVTQIESVQTSAISDGTFADGWKWIFNVTVPTVETLLQMKFAAWTNGTNTIPASGNMRIFSAQATDANSESTAYTIDSSNAYSSSTIMHLNPVSDLDSTTDGRQIQITVETAIPAGTPNGSYSTSYGINAEVDPTLPVTPGGLALTTGSDNPQTTTLIANQNSATQGVVLNTFTLQATSTDVELNTLPITLTTSTASSSALIQDVKLYQGTTLLDTESSASATTSPATIVFKNINLSIPEGTTDGFKVVADIQPISGTNPAPNGSSAIVTVPGTGASATDAYGNAAAVIGASTGYPISFQVNGLSIASSPTTASATAILASENGTTQTGTFSFVFNVTAFGQTIYVGSTSSAFSLSLIDASTGTATTTGISSAISSSANRSPMGNFQVNSGQTTTFTVTASKTGGSSHYFYVILNSLNYGTSDAAPATQLVTLPSNYTTNAVSISS